jgi:hypothetical protein
MPLIPLAHLDPRGDPARRVRLMELVRVRLDERRYATRTVSVPSFRSASGLPRASARTVPTDGRACT